jgi:hypothetical protein
VEQDARHPAEDRADRLSADRHRAFLDVASQGLQKRQLFAGRNALDAEALRQHGLRDDQLANRIDQAVELGQVDADGLARRRGR